MKKLALALSVIALSATSQAKEWGYLDFPTENPYYHTVTTQDTTNAVELEISCMKGFKDTRTMVFNRLDESFDMAEIKFYPSSKDKIGKIVEGELYKSDDPEIRTISIITDETATDLMAYFKLLHSVNAEIKKSDETIVKYKFDLTGSSKSLNIFESKCAKIK